MSPQSLEPSERSVRLCDLATWLSWPAVRSEAQGHALIGGVASQPPDLVFPVAKDPLDTQCVHDIVLHAISESVGNSKKVVVSLSGGLDSFAVLCLLLETPQAADMDIVAISADLRDDAGRSATSVISSLLNALPRRIELVVIKPEDEGCGPHDLYWSENGPRLDSAPLINNRIALAAVHSGASVILTGAGADEAFGMTRYGLWPGLFHRGFHYFHGYWTDSISVSRQAFASELLGALSPAMPSNLRTRLYLAYRYPEMTEITAPAILADEYQPYVSEWSSAWLRNIIKKHEALHKTWASMDGWEMIHPMENPIRSDDPVPFISPFMTTEVIDYMGSHSILDRYDWRYPTAYWRAKSVVLSLIPEHLHPVLPRAKQIFGSWLTTHDPRWHEVPPLLSDLGLIRKDASVNGADPMLIHRLWAIEDWVRIAGERGYCFV